MMLHGVAHLRISTSPCALDADFYAVFARGEMLPIRFASWAGAFRYFEIATDGVTMINGFPCVSAKPHARSAP